MKGKCTSNIKILFACYDARMIIDLIKTLSIPPSLVYDGEMLEEHSVHIVRSSDSTMDPKYSLNVSAISIF